MKKFYSIVFSILLFASAIQITNAQGTYEDGAKDAVAMVNSLKANLLSSGYKGWGELENFELREIKNGKIGEVVNPYSAGAFSKSVIVYKYFWSQPTFNAMAWGDISVMNVKDWAYNNRNVNDYYRGYYDFFTNYWFFDDFLL